MAVLNELQSEDYPEQKQEKCLALIAELSLVFVPDLITPLELLGEDENEG